MRYCARIAVRLIVFTFAFTITVLGQGDADVCTVGIDVAPDIRGIQLGMSYADARRMFSDSLGFRLAQVANEVGEIEVELGLLDWPTGSTKFKGINKIHLKFIDVRIAGIGVGYDAETQWPSIDAFTSQISKTLTLPAPAWQKPNNADPTNARVMYCNGFRVIALINKGGPSFIGLVDIKAEQLVKERRAAIEEKKRHTFKP